MRRAYSYIRFSSPEQATGDSFRRQTEFTRRYVEKHGLTLDDSLNLHDLGMSAFRGANIAEGSLAGFLEAIKSGRVPKGSVLIVESVDRLSRTQVRVALELFIGILNAGVSIVTCQPEREYTPENSDSLALIEPLLYFARANEESQTKSTRIAASWDSRRRAATEHGTPMTPVCPAWIELRNGKYALIPERVKTVKKVFKWSREGLGTFAIAKRLREESVSPFGRSKSWNTAYVRLLLTDRRALGEYQPKKLVYGRKTPADDKDREHMVPLGDVIPGYYPAAVTETEFYAAAGTIKARKGKGGRGTDTRNLLKGLVWNASDGQKMYYSVQKAVAYLDSTAGYYGKKAAKGRSVRYWLVEDCVLTMLSEIPPASVIDGGAGVREAVERVVELEGRLAEVSQKLETVTERARTAADVETYLDLIERLRADKKRITAELNEQRAKAETEREGGAGSSTPSLVTLSRTERGAKLEGVRQRLRARIAQVVKAVWVKIEQHNRNKKTVHVQIHLNANGYRTRTIYWPVLTDTVPSADDTDESDFSERWAGGG